MPSFDHCFVAVAILVCALTMALAQTDESENVQISSKCSDDHFPCDPYVCPCNTVIFKCIPRSWTCDGAFDCADRTDDPPNCTPPSGATAGGRKKRTVEGPEPGRPKAGEE
ncbi:hypothetical protein AAVH_27256 [Aphelenchoides avenae]|nr:hypothetical protein AAVH_27256 [Aphelenchus avenae]